MCVHAHVNIKHATALMWRSEESLGELAFSLYYVTPICVILYVIVWGGVLAHAGNCGGQMLMSGFLPQSLFLRQDLLLNMKLCFSCVS